MSEIIFKVTGVIDAAGEGGTRSGGGGSADTFAKERASGDVTSIRLGGVRAGDGVHELRATVGEDLVVVQIAGGGPELILHPETARELFQAQAGAQVNRSGSAPNEVEVPTSLAWPTIGEESAERGKVADAVGAVFSIVKRKGKELLGQYVEDGIGGLVEDHVGDVVKQRLAGWAGEKIGDLVDSKVVEGVYTLARTPTWPLAGQTPRANIEAGRRPHLVLVHGTFVNTESTFGALWANSSLGIGMLFDAFEGVHALDHATMGRSPVDNALNLAKAFGDGARLHLLTHSRGGLVAEVLVRAAAAQGNVADADSYRDDEGNLGAAHAQLVLLIELLHARRITVERVTRVACPVWGTLLASDRLDAYVSVLRWALKLAGLAIDPLIDFAQAVAATRANPDILPGLEAMRPGSALTAWVNGGEISHSSLRVVAGDVKGDSVFGWVKMLVGDSFFWMDNDLVVQTRSMYGGVPRSPGNALYRFFSSGKATHFSYFTNQDIVFPVLSAVLEEKPREFGPIGPESRAGLSESGARAAAAPPVSPADHPEKPVVFVLPGILGSHLRVGDERVWLSPRILGALERIEYPEQAAVPDGVIESSYAELIAFLGRSHHVVPFPYDWRKPIEEEARRLGDWVERACAVRAAHNQPVRFLAHSMGGLVVRTFMLECPELWQRVLSHPEARFLMLGTPNAGSWVPMQVFTGDDDFGNLLAFAGSPFKSGKARQVMAGMPGFVQLQAGLRTTELGMADTWTRLWEADKKASTSLWHKFTDRLGLRDWALPHVDVLDAAKRLRARLDEQIVDGRFRFAERTSLVVGSARRTPDGYQTSAGRGLLYVEVVEGGDGRVTHDSACLPGVATWQVPREHGKLADVSAAFEGYRELLESGKTKHLGLFSGVMRSGTPKVLSRVLVRPSRLRQAPRPPGSPDEIFSARVEDFPPSADVPELRVSVQTGDLRFVEQPLLIGHYSSLTLTGAEAVVDRFLGGSMRKYLETRAYPSEPGESATFPNQRRANPFRLPRPEGVIVVGLGNESSLHAGDLQKTVTRGVLNWVKTLVHSERGAPAELQIAATLIGSGGLGITTDVSARSIALGVQKANERLRAVGWPVVSSLTLVEIYKSRAREAHSAVSMLTDIEGHRIRVDQRIKAGLGAKWGYTDGAYRGAKYDLVSIVNTKDGGESSGSVLQTLHYAVSTRRARTEVETHAVQGNLVDQIIESGARGAALDPRVGVTLFRMLVPMSMAELLGQSKRLVLELEPAVAGIPWEVLTVDDASDGVPWAISCKLVRKLRLEGWRSRPRDTRTDDAILVVGEPQCDTKKYPRLPGALNEARAVVRELQGFLGTDEEAASLPVAMSPNVGDRGGVFMVEHADAPAIVHELNARPYRIIHIAGHGEPGAGRGVVLSGGAFLGPREIRDLREVPELVFVNCCHLGTLGSDRGVEGPGGTETSERTVSRPAFAADVAEALIKIGVKCVVAAGWAVDDAAASAFAEAFYRTLFKARPFSDAVAEGRKAARAAAPSSMTWAAYQCYGDPEWTLARTARPDLMSEAEAMAAEFVTSADELALRLEDLAVDCRYKGGDPNFGSEPRPPDLTAEIRLLDHFERRYGVEYAEDGRVAQAFAEAHKFAGQSEQALEWYRRAATSEDGKAAFTALEQWANVAVRNAWDRIRHLPAPEQADIDQALSVAEEAISQLEALVSVKGTAERHALLASAFRRRMWIEGKGGRDEQESFERSTNHYAKAAKLGPLEERYYPALNVLINRCSCGPEPVHLGAFGEVSVAEIVETTQQSLKLKMKNDPSFFAAVSEIELELYGALIEGKLDADLTTKICDSFRDLRARVPSVHEWRSTRDSARLVSEAWPQSVELKRVLRELEGYAGSPS